MTLFTNCATSILKDLWISIWTMPQADPAERANRQVQEALRAAVTTVGSYDEWDKALPHICFGLNNQVSSVTGISPFELPQRIAQRHKLAMRWYGPYEVLEVFAGGGTVRLRLPEELGRISTVVNIRCLKFSELRDA
jgi:hypothetical protein